MQSAFLREVVAYLGGTLAGRYALIHEATAMAYGLGAAAVPAAVDVLVGDEGSGRPSGSFEGVPLRVWAHVSGITLDDDSLVWNLDYGVYVPRPELTLEAIEL
ncbi:hypothetical protein [Olsenella sp. Marseille-P4559]|uniref:hypothetical protein n=1 Tax=Olsenella sp. Marseille-P4559 TaxID=2364795 RepID=UPI001031A33A|nr:hypothetical protein [Olsenella sp. Marseille-P4559]